MRPRCGTGRAGWPLERILFALAGILTLVSAALAALVSPWFLAVAVLVGVNQLLFVAAGVCPASIVLTRWLRVRAAADR
jgi:Zn-dependent protease